MSSNSSRVVENWMGALDDHHLLSELSIPGTHDTMTYLVQGGWVPEMGWATCQELSLEGQLQRGIRFIDVRLFVDRPNGPVLHLCHGSVDIAYSMEYVMEGCCRFLRENPSECIVVSVKNDRDDRADQPLFAELVAATVNDPRYRDFWYTGKTVPRLGDVRRRMVLLRRFPLSDLGINANERWPDNQPFTYTNTDGVKFDVQDEYKSYSHFNRSKKFNSYVLPTLRAAIGDTDMGKVFINFTSGTGSVWPRTLAETVNPMVADYFANAQPGRYGILPMDFPEHFTGSRDLTAAIASRNPVDRLVDGGIYELRPKLAPGSALDVLQDKRTDNADIGIYGAHSVAGQRWMLRDAGDGYFFLHPQNAPDKVLAVADSGTVDGTKIILWHKIPKDDQKWKFQKRDDGLFTLSPRHAPDSVLDVYDAHTADESPVKLYHYYPRSSANNAFAQRWLPIRVG